MKSKARFLVILFALLFVTLALSACEGLEDIHIIFGKGETTTAATTTVAPGPVTSSVTTAPPPPAPNPVLDGLQLELLSDGSYAVKGYTGDDYEVEIPASYNGVPISTILKGAFSNRMDLFSVKIPASVTCIKEGAFDASLVEGVFDGSLLVVYAEVAVKPDGWEGNSFDYNTLVVWDCLNNDFAIVDGVKIAFVLENGIVYEIFPEGVFGFSSYEAVTFSFQPGYAKIEEIQIPSYVMYKGKEVPVYGGMIGGFEKLTTLTVSGEVTSLEIGACPNLTSVTLGEGIEFFGIYNCEKLPEIEIPGSVKELSEEFLYGCTSLTNVILCEGIETIGACAFKNCGITSIKIPASVTSIAWNAFTGAFALSEITVDPANSTYFALDGNLYAGTPDSATLIRYASEKNEKAFTVPSSVHTIACGAFEACTSLESVTIPLSVTTIEYDAFVGCDKLTITTDHTAKPDGWDDYFNPDDRPVFYKSNLPFEVEVVAENPYTGKEITPVYVKERPIGTRTTITYERVDLDGNVLETLPKGQKPVDCGNYKVTVTLSWQGDRTGALPAPFTGNFVIVPGSLASVQDNFGAEDVEILYKAANMDFDPIDSALVTGSLPQHIVRVASIVKLPHKDDTSAGTPTAVPGRITSADGAGYFRVTVTYVEETGYENYHDEHTVSHSAVVYVREINKVAKKLATAPTLDGVIDAAYGEALFETEYQACLYDSNGRYLGIDIDNLVDPYQFAAMAQISRGAEVTDDYIKNNSASAEFYAAWDGEFVYIAIKVTDKTPFTRSKAYTSQPNPWVNDCVELYYSFGGDNVPDVSQVNETFPTYKALVRDSATGAGAPTAIKSQKSHYYNDVKCVVTGYGEGINDANTYIIEYKIPAKSEGYTGVPGGTDYATTAGDPLVNGDFIYLAYQIDDLTGLPYKRLKNGVYNATEGILSDYERWGSIEEYDALIAGLEEEKYGGNPWAVAFGREQRGDTWKWYNYEMDLVQYIYNAGNRSVGSVHNGHYLRTPGCAPMIIQLGE